jgi:asparagine synthase (glutamine-hydrolysing)
MCGIAGVLSAPSGPPVSFEELRRMAAMLGHRGPDGYGLYRDGRVGFAHSRLSLIDLSGGAQPIRNDDGSVWMVFNGEIFNYIELRRELRALGRSFYTDGDSEVIVQCYEQYGPRAWTMLNGQFAFALWDRRIGKLWLVRDRVGILPLHYARTGGALVFASEAKALFAGGRMAPRFNPRGVAEAFTCWSATAPRTVFEGVKLVPPATAMCFDERLGARETRYWEPNPSVDPALDRLDAGEAAEALEAHLKRSVALRLRADVPVGAYVSGGLDSSVISSLAKDQLTIPLDTFGVRFEDPRFDETAEQRLMAERLGSRHHEFLCGAADIREALEDVVWHCETPLLRTAPAPLFLLSKKVREAGIKTVLTGEGADELLAGYTIFKEDQIRRFWARRPESTMRPALLSRIHHYVGGEDARSNALWRNFFSRGLTDTQHPFYSHLIRWQNTAWTLRLLTPEVRNSITLDGLTADLEAGMPGAWREWEPLARAQFIEIQSFLSSYLLSCQGDRVAMAHSVEARYPFLDPDLADFALALPKRHKLLGTRDKLALRKMASRRLPEAVWRRRKQPYRAPVGTALFGREANARFDGVLSETALAGDGLCDARAVGQLLGRAERRNGVSLGEREDMGLAGVLTLSLLGRQFGPEFAGRAAEARRKLDGCPLHIFVDQAAEAMRETAPASPAQK